MKFMFPAVLAVFIFAANARAQTTVFTYHGQLQSAGIPANGVYDLRFTLHDASSGGNQVGSTITNAPLGVTNGLFVATLNFGGSPFNGDDRWLEIGVRTNGSTNAYSMLSPRQPITSTPYAIRAANFSGTLPTANLTGTLPDALLSANVALLNTNAIFQGSVTAVQFNGSGAGLSSVPATSLTGTLLDARLSTNVVLLNSSPSFTGSVTAPFFNGNGTGLTNVPGRIFEVIPTATNIQSVANTGYLATNDASSVVVTLPVTANVRVGETIRVSASGAGGWILAQNAGQVILAGNLLGPIGVNWATNATLQTWKSIASSVDGKRLVAAAATGIQTSTDYGATWTPHASSPNAVSVASSGDGSKLVAVVNGTIIYTWTDASPTWTPRLGNANWSAVASSLDGTKLVATIKPGQIYTSGNSGVNWGVQALSPSLNWSSVASSADGQKLVATVQGGMIYTSTDGGVHWSPRESNQNWVSVASSADGSRLVAAVNGGQLYVSANSGTNWIATSAPAATAWSSVASSADGSILAAVFNLGSIFISMDSGLTWATRTGLPSLGWTTVASSADASTLAVAGNSTRIFVSSQATTTPGTAGYLSGSRLSAVEVVHCGGGVFMPITSMGTVRAR